LKSWIRTLPAIIWMIVIFISSHQPGEALEEGVLQWLKALFPFIRDLNFGHFIAYFVLSFTVYFALGPKWMNWRGKLLSVLICVLYGVTDEFHQMFVPGRAPDVTDIRNDAIGAAIAMLIASINPVHRLILRLAEGKKF
jgi:Predicted integral membrane protein